MQKYRVMKLKDGKYFVEYQVGNNWQSCKDIKTIQASGIFASCKHTIVDREFDSLEAAKQFIQELIAYRTPVYEWPET